MGLLDWLGRNRGPREDPRLQEWKRAWSHAVAVVDAGAARELRSRLESFGLPDDDIEIEREMLEALENVVDLSNAIRQSGLPLVPTGHRVVGHEPCHLVAAAAMPDEPGHPTGRLLLTSGRAIFVGGPKGLSTAWHTLAEAQHAGRDLVLVRTGRDRLYRFQCNSFSDAICATRIARELIPRRPL
jgi:hypothetical protein